MKLSDLLHPRRVYWKVVGRILWTRETWAAAREVAPTRGRTTLGVLLEQARLYRKHDLDQYAYYWYRLYDPGRAAAAFPWARAIGWDIGLSDRGPVLMKETSDGLRRSFRCRLRTD